MAEDINRIVLAGRLTRDAELKYSPVQGFPILRFSLAVNRSKKSGDKWVDEASFFDVVLFGKRGESVAEYLPKGRQVIVEGHLKQDRWTDNGGQNHSKVSIECERLQLLSAPKGQEDPEMQTVKNAFPDAVEVGESATSKPQNNGYPQGSFEGFEDDIPF